MYSFSMSLGLLLEAVGFFGRLLLRNDLASKSFFFLSLLGTAVGPTLISAAIYTILPHVLALCGSDLSTPLEPIWLNYFFLAFDGFTVAFQVVGCVFAAEGYNRFEVSIASSAEFNPDCITRSDRLTLFLRFNRASTCSSSVSRFKFLAWWGSLDYTSGSSCLGFRAIERSWIRASAASFSLQGSRQRCCVSSMLTVKFGIQNTCATPSHSFSSELPNMYGSR